jgi:cytochrome c-type biogenesis protein CcmE
MNKYGKFAILMAIILGSLGFLAYSGIQASATYYMTITELRQMGNSAQTRHVRVGGDVQTNSIVHQAGLVKFNLIQEKQILPVAYEGRDPLPDRFRDGALAEADGRLGPDGVFHASEIIIRRHRDKPSKITRKPRTLPSVIYSRAGVY